MAYQTEDRSIDNPQAFISHASEDKQRFVLRFAERLLSKGIKAWVDEWEMLPGDKLVDKVFNHGLRASDAVIVVLSNISLEKPWVQKELNTAVIKNIEDRTRLIPVRLDGCEIPECLRDAVYQNIRDLDNYDREFDRIVKAVYGQYDTPPIGNRPLYAEPDVLRMDGLCRNDSLFLAEACRIALKQGHPAILSPDALVAALTATGMSEQDILDAQEVLSARYYIDTARTIGKPCVYGFNISTAAFRAFAEAGGIPDYAQRITDVARLLVERVSVNSGQVTNHSVESELGLTAMLVEHIFERLRDEGLIKYSTHIGGRLFMYVYSVSPELRRKLEGNT